VKEGKKAMENRLEEEGKGVEDGKKRKRRAAEAKGGDGEEEGAGEQDADEGAARLSKLSKTAQSASVGTLMEAPALEGGGAAAVAADSHWERVLILAAKSGDIDMVGSLPDLKKFANCRDQVRVRACVRVCVCVVRARRRKGKC